MKKIFTFFIAVLPMLCAGQYEYLRINNVNWGWYNQPGAIDSVLMEVTPKGIYNEIGMTFNFSTAGTSFSPYDSLEIEMLFKLPPQAEVVDMWLWVDDTIIVADVYDKWTASQIYEDIVDRRTDPAILYRYNYSAWDWNYYQWVDYSDYYMLKVFPLLTTLPRKVKFTYLVKNTDAFSQHPSVSLPLNILALSNLNIPNTCIRFYPSAGMGSPLVEEMPSATFALHTGSGSNYYEANIVSPQTSNSLTLSYTQNNTQTVAVGDYFDPTHVEHLYQLQLKPGDLFGLSNNKKALFVFDFIQGNSSSLSCTQLLAQVKSKILNELNAYDSVNFMFSGFITHCYSPNWIPADSASVTAAFNTFNLSWFTTYSNLGTVLTDGIQFIKDHNNTGNIILIASSNSNGDYQQANLLINDLMGVMGTPKIPIQIIDLNETSWPQYYIGNQYFIGNQYLYVNLSLQTSGEYFTIRNEDLNEMLKKAMSKLSGYFSNFDMYVTLEFGYTYSNFDLFAQSGLAYFDEPAQKVGKYNGYGRFRVIAHGQLPSGQLLSADTLIDYSLMFAADASTRAMWAAQLIRELAAQSQTNTIINQIITTSMDERVLSDYTAFLALEPGLGPLNPDNGSGPTAMNETSDKAVNSLGVFPNPFSDHAQITYRLDAPAHIVIEIFNLVGERIATIADADQQSGEYSIDFDPGRLAAGTYLCRLLINGEEIRNTRMVKIK